MMVGAGDDHVGVEVGGARQQHVRHRQVALQGLLRMGGDAVPFEMTDDAVEPRPVALEMRLARPHHEGTKGTKRYSEVIPAKAGIHEHRPVRKVALSVFMDPGLAAVRRPGMTPRSL